MSNTMKVAELRDAIREMTEPCKGSTAKGVYRMPDGSLVSKAKREPLLAYYSQLMLQKTGSVPKPKAVLPPVSNELITRYRKKVRKYTKRRQTPGNVRTLTKWRNKLERAEQTRVA